MNNEKLRVSSGISHLDKILGGLAIGDNVLWYDEGGSLAWIFCLTFMRVSKKENKPLIYISFDRSPKNLLETIGQLAENQNLTIIDCFTHGKGNGSDIFLKFYKSKTVKFPCKIIQVKNPHSVDQVMDTFFGIHGTMKGDVRFVFDSLTGMQHVWKGEENILYFYSQACPRLYELNTIAYWIIEKQAHSSMLRANLNRIAQVSIELSLKRGKSFVKFLKAENRTIDCLNKPFQYWQKGENINIESETGFDSRIELGKRLKEFRSKCGISQTELGKLIGVTASNISQIESNLIYPSLPSLYKIAEILSVDVSSFFKGFPDSGISSHLVFTPGEAIEIQLSRMPEGQIEAKRLTPIDFKGKADPYLIIIQPESVLSTHFFIHKGEEIGYLLSENLTVKIEDTESSLHAGDTIYLISEMPSKKILVLIKLNCYG